MGVHLLFMIVICSPSAVMTTASAGTTAAKAAVTTGGWASCSVRSAARIAAVFSARRRARLSVALTWAVVSRAAEAGSGAPASSSRASGASRSSNASNAAGKKSRSWWRNHRTAEPIEPYARGVGPSRSEEEVTLARQ